MTTQTVLHPLPRRTEQQQMHQTINQSNITTAIRFCFTLSRKYYSHVTTSECHSCLDIVRNASFHLYKTYTQQTVGRMPSVNTGQATYQNVARLD